MTLIYLVLLVLIVIGGIYNVGQYGPSSGAIGWILAVVFAIAYMFKI